jgi:hypothetical protein
MPAARLNGDEMVASFGVQYAPAAVLGPCGHTRA